MYPVPLRIELADSAQFWRENGSTKGVGPNRARDINLSLPHIRFPWLLPGVYSGSHRSSGCRQYSLHSTELSPRDRGLISLLIDR